MKKKFTVAFIFYSSFLAAQTNINISNYPFYDTEPFIAVNPSNSNNLVATWMKLTGITQISLAVSYSTNGGASWNVPVVMPHLYPSFTHADPSLVFAANGTAFICYIDYAPSKDSGYVMVANSTNNGQTWSMPVQVISGTETPDLPVDRPWITIDNSGGINDGRLYVTSKSVDIGALPHHVWMKSSPDGGLTWSPLRMIDDSIPSLYITNSMGIPSVGDDGNLYIAYFAKDQLLAPPRFICAKSTDGGNNFIPYTIATAVTGSAITDSLYQGSYCLSANPSNNNHLVFIVTDARFGDPDILFVSSNDGGITWSSVPVRINDDPVNNGAGQDMCWGSFAPGGTYACAWRDRRNGGAGSSAPFEIFTAALMNGGNIFSVNYNVSTAPSPLIAITKGNDFLGISLDNSYVYTNWCDLRTGNTEIFTSKNSLSSVLAVEDRISDSSLLSIFPNPFENKISILFYPSLQYPDRQKSTVIAKRISVTNILGKTVFEKDISVYSFTITKFSEFDLSFLSNGIYTLSLETKEKIYYRKLLKM